MYTEKDIANDSLNCLRMFLYTSLQVSSVKQEVQQASGMIQFLYNLTNNVICGKIK